MFEDFPRENLTLKKKSSGHIHHFLGIVSKSTITTFGSVPIEDGDLIERPTPACVEIYTVMDRGYHPSFNEIPAHYQMRVQKITAPSNQVNQGDSASARTSMWATTLDM